MGSIWVHSIEQLTREQISMRGGLEYMPMPRRARPHWECGVNGPWCGHWPSTLDHARPHWV